MEKYIVKKGFSIAWKDKSFNAGEEIPFNKDFENYIEKIECKMIPLEKSNIFNDEMPKKRSKK